MNIIIPGGLPRFQDMTSRSQTLKFNAKKDKYIKI